MRKAVLFSISALALAVIGIVPGLHVQTASVPQAAGKAGPAEPAASASGRTVTIHQRAASGHFDVASVVDPGAPRLHDQRLDRKRRHARHGARADRYRHRLAHRTQRGATVLARRRYRPHLARHVVPIPRVLAAPRPIAGARVVTPRRHRFASDLCAVHSIRHASAARHASHRLARAHARPTQSDYSVSGDARFPEPWSGSSPKPYLSPIGDVISATVQPHTVPSFRFCRRSSAPQSFAPSSLM